MIDLVSWELLTGLGSGVLTAIAVMAAWNRHRSRRRSLGDFRRPRHSDDQLSDSRAAWAVHGLNDRLSATWAEFRRRRLGAR